MAMVFDTRRAGPGLAHHDERDHDRKRREEHQQEHAERSEPVVPLQVPLRRRLRQLPQPLVQLAKLLGPQHAGDHGRQRPGNEQPGLCRVGGRADRPERREVSAQLAQAPHQVQDAVDDSPRDVASQRADQHRANVFASGFGHAERPGEGQHHDQAEQDLGQPLDRLQDAPRLLGGDWHHCTRGGSR